MNEPLCKLCGVNHWGWCPKPTLEFSNPDKGKVQVSVAYHSKTMEEKKKPFDKAAYQREYMRKRREMKEKK